MNAQWHKKHPMPKNATPAERARWHLAHEKHCACRPMTPSIRKLVNRFRKGS
ncbi:MAG: hypothetical protein AB1405_09900 [Bdellovibrionota bacterium]